MVRMFRFTPHLKMISPGNGRMFTGTSNYEYLETVVSLVRQETGFGFRIVGGTEEGSQVGGTVRTFLIPKGLKSTDQGSVK